jgi:predicted house-cleaning noncanonical NTP pyrophosphatase (MazG superfamily)
MTKKNEEKIAHLMAVVEAVFRAEENISAEWLQKLRAAKELPKEEREKVADEYLRAMAIELLKYEEEGD